MRRHRFDPFSFVAGAAFLAVALTFLPGGRTAADVDPTWYWALPALAVGLLVVLAGIRAALPRREEEEGRDEGPPG